MTLYNCICIIKGKLGKNVFTGHGALGSGLPADLKKSGSYFFVNVAEGKLRDFKKLTHGEIQCGAS